MELIRDNLTLFAVGCFVASVILIWLGWKFLGEAMEALWDALEALIGFVWNNFGKIAVTLVLALIVTVAFMYLVDKLPV